MFQNVPAFVIVAFTLVMGGMFTAAFAAVRPVKCVLCGGHMRRSPGGSVRCVRCAPVYMGEVTRN